MRTLKLFSLFLALLAVRAIGQTVHWEPPSGQLGYNQVGTIALVFENCEPDLQKAKLPEVDGLTFGRASTNSQTSIVNFTVTRQFSLVFPVRPSKRGTLTIPAFDIATTDKGTIHVPAATYTVGDATVGNTGIALGEIANAQLTTPKNSYWVGEVIPITWSLNVLRRYYTSIASNLDWAPAPLVTEDWSKIEPNEAVVKGEHYVISTQTTRGLARQPGPLSLKPASQVVNLVVGSSGFGFFAQPNVEQRVVESNPLDLTIKPLPPAPAGFSGAVGEFKLTSKVVPTTGTIGDPITWTLELSGTGNWPDITGLPARDVSRDFQVVQPKSQRTMKDGSLFEGTLSEDVVLVPTRSGKYDLPSIQFVYFDTRSGSYKTLATDPVTITVPMPNTPPVPAAAPSGPIQFSLPPPSTGAPAAPALPTATPPVPPEKLPVDPVGAESSGFRPASQSALVIESVVAAILPPFLVWLFLAARRSRELDPERPRREALVRLQRTLAELRAAGSSPAAAEKIQAWQAETTALWRIPHAAPGSSLVHAIVATHSRDAAPAWTKLWAEADRARHGRDGTLPKDWIDRADQAAKTVRVPAWAPWSLLAPRYLFPSALMLGLLLLLPGPARGAETGGPATFARQYAASGGPADFKDLEKMSAEWLQEHPRDWANRHNYGLALAQQDRWAEATAQWTAAYLLNPGSETTRWDLSLGLKRSGFAPPELVEFSRAEGRYALARWFSPGGWQLAIILAALLLATGLSLVALIAYRRIGAWGLPVAIATCLLGVLLAGAGTFSLHTYGLLADPNAVIVWRASTLRSIPTELETPQKTSPLSAGSIAVVEKTLINWSRLRFPGGQEGWARSEDLTALYKP